MVARCERVVQWDFQRVELTAPAEWRAFGLETSTNAVTAIRRGDPLPQDSSTPSVRSAPPSQSTLLTT